MTTWTTFETIDEISTDSGKVSRLRYSQDCVIHSGLTALGNVQRTENQWDRPSSVHGSSFEHLESTQWRVIDLEEDEHTKP